MSTATTASPIQRELGLLGQTVVVIGGSAGIGLETARRARAEGAKLILTGRNLERLQRAASELDDVSPISVPIAVSAAVNGACALPAPRVCRENCSFSAFSSAGVMRSD